MNSLDSVAKAARVASEHQHTYTNHHRFAVCGIVGVRVLREGPAPGIQEMSGYFLGPLGKIDVVTCLYPVDRQSEFQPIANAIIYSFEF